LEKFREITATKPQAAVFQQMETGFFIGNPRRKSNNPPMSRILLVEDEPAIADTLVYALDTECFTVSHESTGRDALKAHSEEPYDLVILDIGLPDMTGMDVCRQLREKSTVPILFLTARAGEMDRILGLELGGDDYVTKPFSPREIVARVRAILRRAGHGGTVTVTTASPVAGLSHDSTTMRIRLDGVALDLTAHEYKLLLVLMEAPGRVFSRDQLLDHAWPDPGAVTDRTVDAHIKSIRAKLRSARTGTENMIETRRGLGYSLCADS